MFVFRKIWRASYNTRFGLCNLNLKLFLERNSCDYKNLGMPLKWPKTLVEKTISVLLIKSTEGN